MRSNALLAGAADQWLLETYNAVSSRVRCLPLLYVFIAGILILIMSMVNPG